MVRFILIMYGNRAEATRVTLKQMATIVVSTTTLKCGHLYRLKFLIQGVDKLPI